MTKKLLPWFVICSLLVGCSTDSVQEAPTDDTLALSTQEEVVEETISDVDYDLTLMSPTMVLAQAYDMLSYPDNYAGSTIRIEGVYTYYEYPETGIFYFIVVNDDAACCSQGIDIRFPEEIVPPENFGNFVIEGVIGTEVYNDYTYLHIQITSMEPA